MAVHQAPADEDAASVGVADDGAADGAAYVLAADNELGNGDGLAEGLGKELGDCKGELASAWLSTVCDAGADGVP